MLKGELNAMLSFRDSGFEGSFGTFAIFCPGLSRLLSASERPTMPDWIALTFSFGTSGAIRPGTSALIGVSTILLGVLEEVLSAGNG